MPTLSQTSRIAISAASFEVPYGLTGKRASFSCTGPLRVGLPYTAALDENTSFVIPI